jgi:hypothetical protein
MPDFDETTLPAQPPTASDQDAAPEPEAPVGGSVAGGDRRRLLAFIAITLALVVGALGWLFWSEGAQPAAPPVALETLPRVDGTLLVVERDRLVMKPFEPLNGQARIEFAIPEQYRQYFDLAHLRSHASVGIPTRIYYLERDGGLLAVYKGDAPVNSKPSSGGP